MKKKKIITVIAAVAVVASLALGSLAWFTSKDSVTNNFSTVSTDEPNSSDAGIKIHEEFDKTTAGNVLPGTVVNKQVSVNSTAKYDQLVRVKLEKVWKDSNGNIVDGYYITKKDKVDEHGAIVKDKDGKVVQEDVYVYCKGDAPTGKVATKLENDYIELGFDKNLGEDKGKWIDNTAKDKDGYYYYNGVLAPKAATSELLNSVTLNKHTPNVYRGLKFDVVVTAEGIQSVNGAVKDAWKTAPGEITKLGGELKAK